MRDIRAVHSYDNSAVGNNHYVVLVGHLLHIDKIARDFVEYTRFDTHTRSALKSVIFEVAAFAVAVRRYRQHVLSRVDYQHIDEAIVFRELHCLYACGVSAHRAHSLFGEADTFTRTRSYHKLVSARSEHYRYNLVVVVQFDSDFAVFVYAVEFAESGLFD